MPGWPTLSWCGSPSATIRRWLSCCRSRRSCRRGCLKRRGHASSWLWNSTELRVRFSHFVCLIWKQLFALVIFYTWKSQNKWTSFSDKHPILVKMFFYLSLKVWNIAASIDLRSSERYFLHHSLFIHFSDKVSACQNDYRQHCIRELMWESMCTCIWGRGDVTGSQLGSAVWKGEERGVRPSVVRNWQMAFCVWASDCICVNNEGFVCRCWEWRYFCEILKKINLGVSAKVVLPSQEQFKRCDSSCCWQLTDVPSLSETAGPRGSTVPVIHTHTHPHSIYQVTPEAQSVCSLWLFGCTEQWWVYSHLWPFILTLAWVASCCDVCFL